MSNRSFRGIRVIRFNDFEFDVRASELRRDGVRVRLQEQPFRILSALLERPGELLTREEVRKRLWPNNTAVEISHGINAAVQRLREALGDSADNPQFIETIPRRGYRFIAPLQFTMTGQTDPVPQPETDNREGNEVSHFRVMEKLGSGGMGVVYRAEDLKLGRQVALKFLPRELTTDTGALSRFRREAQAASSLNHPNICTIYGVEECDGQPVIVMELLEGETLEVILSRGALPVEETVSMAICLVGALDAAHRKGIVHRDLKPANILAGKLGLKVLDFGLAKMDKPVVLSFEGQAYATQKGVILGTLHYMSPEQVQGKDADASSDIFSFGVVLYEMLTGRRAFEGPNTAKVMAAILTLEPPPLARPIPPALELVLRRCLAKEPEERWQTARDLKAALECLTAPEKPPPIPPPSAPPLPLPEPADRNWRLGLPGPFLLGLATLCLIGASAFQYLRSRTVDLARIRYVVPDRAASLIPSPPALRGRSSGAPTVSAAPAPQTVQRDSAKLIKPLPTQPFQISPLPRASVTKIQNTSGQHLSLSPDGKRLAYIEAGNLRVLQLSSGEILSPGKANGSPFWSPDARSIAVTQGGRLLRFDLDGSAPRQICEIATILAGAWGPDGTILIGLLKDGLYRVPATGGALMRITAVDSARGETRHLAPQFLPGGQQFLYIRGTTQAGQSMLYIGSLQSGKTKAIMPVESNVEFVPSQRDAKKGYLVFAVGKILSARAFDVPTLTVSGTTLTLGSALASAGALDATLSIAEFSATESLLVFRTLADRKDGITVVPDWTKALRLQASTQ